MSNRTTAAGSAYGIAGAALRLRRICRDQPSIAAIPGDS
jgi:hypothetical protein